MDAEAGREPGQRDMRTLERNVLIIMAAGFFIVAAAVLVAPQISFGSGRNPANATTSIASRAPVSYSESNSTTTTIIQHNAKPTGYNASGYQQGMLNSTGFNQSGANSSVTRDTPYPP